jgi:purine-nucleoside/S-methyl-5'-thioadenosine phosphorylase / adenosine deaminase
MPRDADHGDLAENGAMSAVALHRFESLRDDRLLACYTERTGGVSEGRYAELNIAFHVGDDPAAVVANRERLAADLGLSLDSFVVAQQVHQGHVEVITDADRGRGARSDDDAIPATDALITRQAGIVLAVMTADCVPVIVFDRTLPAVGLAHAGWAGTLLHVTRRTVETMQAEFGSDPASLVAAVGPSIGPTSYEVRRDVADLARAEFAGLDVLRPKGGETYLFDLWESNVGDLVDAGLSRDNVEVARIDTYADRARFYSHRRDGTTGRFMALAMLRP